MADTDLFRDEVFETRKQRLYGDVVLTQALSTRVMGLALFAIIAIAVTWVSLGTYARIETVPGILVTDIPSTKIVATAPGIVTALTAQEGQLVKQGDRIAVISLDRRAISGNGIAGRSLGALESRRELTEQQLGLSRRRAASEQQRLHSVIANAEQQSISLQEQIVLQEQSVASNQQIFDQIAKVVERGFVSKVEFERRRQMLISSQQSLANLRQQLSARMAEAEQVRAQIGSIAVETAQGANEIASSLQGIAQQQAQLEGEQGYVITAPISGRITALQTAIGRTANPNVPLMVIVPDGSELRAELYAPTKAIGFVKKGKQARILFDAFPYQRFGSFGGRIISVSKTVFDPRETDVPIKLEQAVYKITVKLDRQHVTGYGDKIPLQPGMTLNANIVLERQSFLDWILAPLNAVRKRTA